MPEVSEIIETPAEQMKTEKATRSKLDHAILNVSLRNYIVWQPEVKSLTFILTHHISITGRLW